MAYLSMSSYPPCSPQWPPNPPNPKKKRSFSGQNSRIKRQNIRSQAKNVTNQQSNLSNVNAFHSEKEESTQTYNTRYEHPSTQTRECDIEAQVDTRERTKTSEKLSSSLDVGIGLPAAIGHLSAGRTFLLPPDPPLFTQQRQPTLPRNIVNFTIF